MGQLLFSLRALVKLISTLQGTPAWCLRSQNPSVAGILEKVLCDLGMYLKGESERGPGLESMEVVKNCVNWFHVARQKL